MSQSLDNFIRDVMQEHDGEEICAAEAGVPTKRTSSSPGMLPGHEVDVLIARGGMGTAYRARQVELERRGALRWRRSSRTARQQQ